MLSVSEIQDPTPRPMSRAEYDRLIDLGFFDNGERVELIEGVLLEMSPQGEGHIWTIQTLTALLSAALGSRAWVRVQLAMGLTDDSEPEPDLTLVARAGPIVPKPKTALLVVEVSASTLRFDRTEKARLYAQAKIPEYWIVNLIDEKLEVYRQPKRGRYTVVDTLSRGHHVEVQAFPGHRFAVEDILPPK
jgi:Uma2 family endonuclease